MKKVLIYSGVAIGSIAIGFFAYRIQSRWGKKVIQENNTTIIIDEVRPEIVEEVGDEEFDFSSISDEDQKWYMEEYMDYGYSI